jgi:uncharacterized membrane protein
MITIPFWLTVLVPLACLVGGMRLGMYIGRNEHRLPQRHAQSR